MRHWDCAGRDIHRRPKTIYGERIHRIDAVEVYGLDREWLASLVAKLERRMKWALTRSERHVYLSMGEETLACVIERIALAGQ